MSPEHVEPVHDAEESGEELIANVEDMVAEADSDASRTPDEAEAEPETAD